MWCKLNAAAHIILGINDHDKQSSDKTFKREAVESEN